MKLKKGSAAAKAYMAKIRAKRKVGAVAKKDTLKVFYVGFKNRKIREKIEAKSAKDAIKEYQNRLKPIYGSVPATWLTANKKNTLGATKNNRRAKIALDIINLETQIAQMQKIYNPTATELAKYQNLKNELYELKKGHKIGSTLKLKANEKRLGATAKDVKTRSKNYHKDTKSHNVNIKVVSGIGAISLDIVAKELNKLDSEISWHTINIKNEKNTTLKKELIYSKKIKTAQRKALISYLNSIAKFR